ncbi:MAG: sulfotransferase [Acidimicrobiales bacterium]|nr:sulfotransferase [Acidimicrobiales bacterium]
MAALLPMPIHLAPNDAAASPTSRRLVFVVDPQGRGRPVVDALRQVPGLTRPSAPLDLFGRSLHLVLGNYLSAYRVRGGLAALVDDDTAFLRATRRLADSVYGTILRGGGRVVIDDSPTNADAPHVMQGIYPDALFVVVDDNDTSRLLQGPNVVRFYATDTNAVVLRAQEIAEQTGVFPAPRFGDTARLREPPIFVVGCPRSGTTWVQHLLAAHPAVAGPDKETAMFVALRGFFDNPGLEAVMDHSELVAIVRRFAREVFADYLTAHAPHATRFLEKTPIHADHLDLIATILPEAYIVGVHRDGRDVVRSLLEVEAGVRDAEGAATAWVTLTRKVSDFTRRHPRSRDERYENWLREPDVCAIDVLTWLGLPPDDTVIAELRRRAPERVSQYNTTGAVGQGKWRDLAPRDLQAIYRVAGARLVEMGYATPDEVREPESWRERFRRAVRPR